MSAPKGTLAKGQVTEVTSSGAPAREARAPSERDAEHRVVVALQRRGFQVAQDVAVSGAGRKVPGEGIGRVDIYAVRGDIRLIVEMKRPETFRTAKQRAEASAQANRYGTQLGSLYIGTSDGDTLVLEHLGEQYVHQLGGGVLLSVDGRRSPLDVGADYATFADFPRKQRAFYLFEDETAIEREPVFDLSAFTSSSEIDAMIIAGEPGAGKTTYAQQIAVASLWDPLWLDGGTIDDPREALSRAVGDLTGFTGDLRTFVETLQGYRRRDGGSRCGVVVDALDEWATAQRHLPSFLHFAKELGLKVLVFGRARSVDALLGNDRLERDLSVERVDLHPFTDAERDRAESTYVKRFAVKSGFEGRAKEMSRLPEMMAMISAAYAGEAVDPDVTEPELYDRYRRKKCDDAGRRLDIEPAYIHDEIDAVANAMLLADSVTLGFGEAARVSAHLDGLLLAGLLRKEGSPRDLRVRFRFGRIRDDALARRPIADLFEKPIVGRSALDYAAANSASVRRKYVALAVSENVMDGLFLARETGWWKEFAAAVPADIGAREQALVLGYAGARLIEVPELLVKFSASPRAARFAQVHRVPVPAPTWATWLRDALDADALHDVIGLTRTMLESGILEVTDAIVAIDTARERFLGERGFSDEGHTFWPLVAAVCQKMDVVAARRLLRRTIPTFAIARSSSGQMGTHYHGVTYSGEMLKCINDLRDRSPAVAFEAWASATLLHAYATEWRDYNFDGRDISGPAPMMGVYADNGWMMDLIVPTMRTIIAEGATFAGRVRIYRVSPTHPAFRLRAMILTMPIAELETMPTKTLEWRQDPNTGNPPLADALDARASDSRLLREQALDDALDRFGMPVSAAQATAFHERLANGNRRAIRQAERFLADPRFHANDYFDSEFFGRLDWSQRRPTLAAKLVRIAIVAGYERLFLMRQRGYADVIRLALTRPRIQQLLVDLPGMADEFAMSAQALPKAVRARLTPSLYERAGIAAKRNLIQSAHELTRTVAVRLFRRALDDDSVIPEACSGDEDLEHERIPNESFHDVLWFTLVMCHQRWPKRWFRDLGVDLIDRAARFQSPVGVAATVIPIADYIIELQRDLVVVARGIDFLLDTARKGGENLREFSSARLGHLYGGMTPRQRERFFSEFADTKTVATAALFIARNKPDDRAALDRVLALSRSSSKRHVIAGTIWRELADQARALTPIEMAVVDALLDYSDEPTIREVAHIAYSLSHSNPSAGTALLLRIVARAMSIGIQLWEPYEMEYDWSTVNVGELTRLVGAATADAAAGWVEVDVIAQGLASRTSAEEGQLIRSAFETLCSRYETARERYAQWRRRMSMG